MDWLKQLLQSLPLDKISDILGGIVVWWSQMVKDVPPADLPLYAYVGGSIIVLILWVLVSRMLPKPVGGISWMVLFAVLLTPGTALGDSGDIAPASIGVVYGLLMKDMGLAVASLIPILVVLIAGLFIGFIWQLIRGVFESNIQKAREQEAVRQSELLLAGTDATVPAYVPEKTTQAETEKQAVQAQSDLKPQSKPKPKPESNDKNSL